ncbi:lonely Cys domain-containing protein, partial [Streptomyces iranensis]
MGVGDLPDHPGWLGIAIDVSEHLSIVGDWLLSDPTMPPGPEDGGEEWEQQVVSFPVAGRDHRATGHLSVRLDEDPATLRLRTLMARELAKATHFVHYDPTTDTVSAPVEVPWRVDDPDADPFFEIKHGWPGLAVWGTTGGSRVVSAEQSSGALRRRRSWQAKPAGTSTVKLLCFAAEQPGRVPRLGPFSPPPYVPDPLGVVSKAQKFANDAQRDRDKRVIVYATQRPIMNRVVTPDGAFFAVSNEVSGTKFGIERVLREPEGAKLDERARMAGLHSDRDPGPVPDHIRERTLRLVRMVGRQFGATIERDPAYPVLLGGAGALDRMLRNDRALDLVPLFTLDLFERVARADHKKHAPATPLDQKHAPDTPLSPRDKAQVLYRAGQQISKDPRTKLSDYVDPRSLRIILSVLQETMSGPGVDGRAIEFLGLPADASVGAAERSQLLWNDVRGRELIDNLRDNGGDQKIGEEAAKILHLDAPDPAQQIPMLDLVRRALAQGRGPVRIELAEYHLETSGGAFAPNTMIRAKDGSIIGRDHTGQPADTVDLDWTKLTLLRRAPDGTLVADSTVWAPWFDPQWPVVPWLYRADRRDDTRVEVGGLAAPHDEIGELMYRDPAAAQLPLPSTAVLMVPRSRPRPGDLMVGSLPGQGALRSGRSMWAAYGTPVFFTDPATGKTTIALEPDPGGNPLTAEDFTLIQRKAPPGYVALQAPSTTVLGTTVPATPVTPAPDPVATFGVHGPSTHTAGTVRDTEPPEADGPRPASGGVAEPRSRSSRPSHSSHGAGPSRRSGGLPGGSSDTGVDPLVEHWPLGRGVTVAEPWTGDVARVTVGKAPRTGGVREVPVGRVPRNAGKNPGVFRWTRVLESSSRPLSYEVDEAGWVTLPGGEELGPEGWWRIGDDFVHGPTGAVLYGDSGWIGRALNAEAVLEAHETLRYTLTADASGMYLVPTDGDGVKAVHIPLADPASLSAPGVEQGLELTAVGPAGWPVHAWMSPQGPEADMMAPPAGATPVPSAVPTAPYDPEAHYAQIMRDLYGGPQPGVPEALRRLNALRAGVPELRGGPLDLDALTRYVLSLPDNAPLTWAERADLLRVASDPEVANATRLTEFAAFYLGLKGAVGSGVHFTTPNGVRGIDWTGQPLDMPIELDTVFQGVQQKDGRLVLDKPDRAGWFGGPWPFVLRAEGSMTRVTVRGYSGFVREARREVVAELLGRSQVLGALPGNVPLLMLVSLAAVGDTLLPRGAAFTLGRDVWSVSGTVGVGDLPNIPGWLGIAIDVSEHLGIVGDWLLSDPTMPPGPEDGGEEWEQQVVSFPVAGRDHRATGHLSVSLDEDPATLRLRTLMARDLAKATHFVHFDPTTDTVSAPVKVPWPVGGPGAGPFFEIKHGGPGWAVWETTGGPRAVSAAQSSGALRRRRSWQAKPAGTSTVKLLCSDAAQPGSVPRFGRFSPPSYVPDPLGVVSGAQQFVNDAQRDRDKLETAYATQGRVMNRVVTPDGAFFAVSNDVSGTKFGIERVLHEPEGAKLDERARMAGLHSDRDPGPVPDHIRERTLRLVRMVGRQFGATIERHAAYPVLLGGAGALDRMLRNDRALDLVPLFTLDLFERVARADHKKHAPGTPLDQEGKAQVLYRAWQQIAKVPGTKLSDYVDRRSLQIILSVLRETMSGSGVDGRAIEFLGLPADAPVGAAERSRLLWNDVSGRELIANFRAIGGDQKIGEEAAKILHLKDHDPAQQIPMLHLVRRALAQGRGLVREELAEYHLETSGGAFAPTTMIRAKDGSIIGRDHTGQPAGTVDLDWTKLTLLRRAPDGTLVADSTVQAPWYNPQQPEVPPWVYRADRRDDTRVEVCGLAAPHDEIGELMYRDPATAQLPLPSRVVLMVPRSRPRPGDPKEGSLPVLGVQRSGRSMWAAYGTPVFFTDPATGKTTIALEPDPGGNPLTAADFIVERRKAPPGYVALQAPSTTVLGTTVPATPVTPAPDPGAMSGGGVAKGVVDAGTAPAPDTVSGGTVAGRRRHRAVGPREPLSVLSRAELTERVDRVAGEGPAEGMSEERCLVLLRSLREELYPQGVRPAGMEADPEEAGRAEAGSVRSRALDDSAVSGNSVVSSLAAGPGWRGVRSWEGVEKAVAEAGAGAAAFVLARRQGQQPGRAFAERLGHAFAAYNLGEGEGRGVVWVDVSEGAGRRISGFPPGVAPSDARAVVIDLDGRVTHALPAFMQSASPAHAQLDAATGRRYGATGLEAEEDRPIHIEGLTGNVMKVKLAHGPGFKIVTDARPYWVTADGRLHRSKPRVAPGEQAPKLNGYCIAEIVMDDPMASLPGERRWPRQEALRQLQRIRAALAIPDERGVPVPLSELLETLGGWTPTEWGTRTLVGLAVVDSSDSSYFHLTPGTVTLGLGALQDLALDRANEPILEAVTVSMRFFGQQTTTAFVNRFLGDDGAQNDLVPFLAAIPDVDEVFGYGWWGSQHAAAWPIRNIFAAITSENVLTKNFLLVASRNPMDRVRRTLRPRTRTFLNERYDELTGMLFSHLSELLEFHRVRVTPDKPFDAGFFDATNGNVTTREYWTAILTGRTSQGTAVAQREIVTDDYELDTDEGRLDVALVLPELRRFGYGSAFMTPSEISRAVEEVSGLSLSAYERARSLPAPL